MEDFIMKIANEERPHFSISQLVTYLECPLCYYFQYELSIPWKSTPSAVAFGDVCHQVIETINTSLMEGNPITTHDAIDLFSHSWTSKVEAENIEFKYADESADLLVKGRELVGLYYESFKTCIPIAVELEFRLPILDISTPLFIESHDVVGKIDAISNSGTIIEIKTAGRTPAQVDIDTNMQITLYSWAYRFLYGVPEDKIVVVNLIKTKEPQVLVLNTSRNEIMYTKLFHLIDRVLKSIQQGLWYPNPMNVWGCKSCAYVTECEEQWPLT